MGLGKISQVRKPLQLLHFGTRWDSSERIFRSSNPSPAAKILVRQDGDFLFYVQLDHKKLHVDFPYWML